MEGDSPVVRCGRQSGSPRRVELFGIAAQRGDIPHLRLNIYERPIAYKYREGKMKRTLKRVKVLEIVKTGKPKVGCGECGVVRVAEQVCS